MNNLKLDPTVTLSLIVAVVAIVAPVITSLIQIIGSWYVKKIEYKQSNNTHIKSLFEDFLYQMGELQGKDFSKEDNSDIFITLSKLRGSFLKCLPYIPQKYHDNFLGFYDSLNPNSDPDLKPLVELNKLFPIIRKIIGKL